VVVTGVGIVSPLGIGTQANWDALCAGRSGIGQITHFDASAFSARIAGQVKDFNPLQFIDKKDVKKMDVFIQFAIAASQFAMDDARLTVAPGMATRVGVFIASGIGGFGTIEREHKAFLEAAPGGFPRSSFPHRSSTWRPARCRSGWGRKARTPPPARRAPRRRMRSATPGK
jgi:3-oxoacyl-[acyl-carrier-protein] synthase II